MINFSIFNIPVRVMPWFWITLALIGGGLHANSREAIMQLLLFLIAGFISILVHELGHALTAKSYGKQVEIVLQAFGGYVAYSGGAPLTRKKTFLITAAGPGVQAVLGLIALVMARAQIAKGGMSFEQYFQIQGHLPHSIYFLFILAVISLAWAALNLLPILPLDGGRLVESLLGPRRQKTTLMISFLAAAAICLLSFTLFSQPILGVFAALFAYQSFKALQLTSRGF